MKISLNWLKKYVDINISNEELVRLIGARLVEVEEAIDETRKYDNIFVVKVVECEAIEGTHLHLCKINNGSEEIQVVCGAPNVHTGMLAAWIAPGAIVPQSVHEDAPFVIGKRKMLGKHDSFGMLAGADELDFGDDHSGIVEIDPEMAKPGDKLADVFDLNDIVLDIENKSLTHRPDCFGMIGFAREVAGILGQKFNEPTFEEYSATSSTKVSIESAEICPRYSAIILKKHGEIKKKYLSWQDTILSKSGMRPVDPIVDITNYLMLLTGQPLHAFDYDKFVAVGGKTEPIIGVRLAKTGETLTLLDDEDVELNENDIVITSNNVPVALAGAMGGKSTMIDDETKNIILESATFSLYNLRKTQMAHGIFSEAITRFTKGQPAYQTLSVAKVCADKLADGFEIAEAIDTKSTQEKENVVKITTPEINTLLGTNYSKKEIVETLENVSFKVEDGDELTVTAPAWRTDIHIKEDIIEEIGRLNGYDNIALNLPTHATANKNEMFELKKQIRDILKNCGANETLTYTFVSGEMLTKAGQELDNSYRLINSISPELQYLRQSIIPSLLEKAYMNIKVPYDNFVLFEMNQTYQKSYGFDEDGVPNNRNKLALVVANRTSNGDAYYVAKKYVEELFRKLGLVVSFKPLQAKGVNGKMLEEKRSAEVFLKDHEEISFGVVGEPKNKILRNFKLPKFTAAVEMDLNIILDAVRQYSCDNRKELIENKVERDLTISTEKEYATIYNQIEQKLAAKELVFKIEPTSIYQPEGKNEKNISFHLEFADRDRVLEAQEILDLMTELEKIA